MPRTAAFTICSRNYLHYAITLMKSLQAVDPEVARFIFLCDIPEDYPPLPEDLATVTGMRDLPIDNLDDLISKYTVIELNTAIKPSCFLHLFAMEQFDQVIYFDPDIHLFRDLSELQQLLTDHPVVLTPHICEPITDKAYPGEQVFLQTGIYNLGFIGVAVCDPVVDLMKWWDARLRVHCVIDLANGYFVDQKWMDYAPSFVPGLKVHHNPAWNVAYWNLMHRELAKEGETYTVNGEPLFFFHYSGLPTAGGVFSKHQDRFTVNQLNPAGKELVALYRKAVEENGRDSYAPISYGYNRFPSGKKIPPFFHHVYLSEPETAKKLGPLHRGDNEQAWLDFALEKPKGYHILNQAALHLYSVRPDLKNAFPEVEGGQELGFAIWFIENAESQADMDEVFIQSVKDSLPRHLHEGGLITRAKGFCFRTLYKIAFKLYPVVERFTSVSFRSKVHLFIKRRAYTPKWVPPPSSHKIEGVPGVNLIGYLEAGSGVGQAARLNLAALEAQQQFPVVSISITTGCISATEKNNGEHELPIGPYALNLLQVNADMTYPVLEELPEAQTQGKQNIGYWYWEMPEFPEEWDTSFAPYREIWVASSYVQQSIAARSPVPVLVLPPPVTVQPDNSFDRKHFGLPEEDFLFLCMGDGLSFLKRKNPMGAYEAFKKAFPDPTAKVKLVVKVLNPQQTTPEIAKWLKTLRADPQVILLDRFFSQAEVHSLYVACNALVSLHRCEGFGLPIAEAMLLGRPVIATGWSSNMDFMTEENSLPVRFETVELTENHGPYKKGMHWAEPSLDHAVERMRFCVENPEATAAIAARAIRDMQENYSPEVSGERMRKRLEFLLQDQEAEHEDA